MVIETLNIHAPMYLVLMTATSLCNSSHHDFMLNHRKISVFCLYSFFDEPQFC